ncbi:oleate hydratase [Saccharibacillus sp. CPCC 101409]|uniref:oleate hydratase n=1 Tax=Saccharibacillus sp. CPCC 101409 TaxID=3058041 RepID=UPI002671F7A6|nr:oleate hydratase [Saccharibacillus sp. CPCC 101409]MDO3411241.1 oleate hydratase [Saccharibacillus sp. CPCC 101409]
MRCRSPLRQFLNGETSTRNTRIDFLQSKEIPDMAATGACCIPYTMLCITAFFMSRTVGDLPKIVPDGCVNFAFIE